MADSIDSTTSQEVPLADWQPLHEPTLISTPLEDGSGQLHSRFGSFDPVWNEFPSSNTSPLFSELPSESNPRGLRLVPDLARPYLCKKCALL